MSLPLCTAGENGTFSDTGDDSHEVGKLRRSSLKGWQTSQMALARKTNSRRHLCTNRSGRTATRRSRRLWAVRRLSASHRSPPPPTLSPIAGTHRRRKVISDEAVVGMYGKGRAAIGRRPSLTVCTAAEAVVVRPYTILGSRPATGARRPH